jgi:hypothetical protein
MDAAFVDGLYHDILERAGDESGKAYWTDLLGSQSATRDDVTYGFWNSTEAANLMAATTASAGAAGASDSQFVDQLYSQILGRTADAAGAAYWNGLLASGTSRADIEYAVRNSAEALALPKFAMGGLTRGPSIAGEDGEELILPLTKPARMRELLGTFGDLIAQSIGGADEMRRALFGDIAASAPQFATLGGTPLVGSGPLVDITAGLGRQQAPAGPSNVDQSVTTTSTTINLFGAEAGQVAKQIRDRDRSIVQGLRVRS